MSAVIRDAHAGDAPFLAWVMQEAGRSHLERGTWDIVLPGPEPERLALLAGMATAEARSFCHYGGFLVAECDGRPAAALCGYQPRETGDSLFLDAVKQVFGEAGWPRARIREMLGRFAPIMTCSPQPAEDAWVVEWVATAPEQRGHGHARLLLDAVLRRGAERGLGLAHLAVLIGNDAAQRLYERRGFVVVEEKRHPDFETATGAPGLRIMELALEPARQAGT